MSTKTILAGIAGGVVAFFAGWLVYGILLMDYYTANTTFYEGLMKDPPDMIFLVISNIAWGFLYAWVFAKIGNIKSFGAGLMNGLVLSFIVMLMFDSSMYAFHNLFPVSFMAVDIAVGTAFGGLVGGAVGFVLGTGK